MLSYIKSGVAEGAKLQTGGGYDDWYRHSRNLQKYPDFSLVVENTNEVESLHGDCGSGAK